MANPQFGIVMFENGSRTTAMAQAKFASLDAAYASYRAYEGTAKPSLPDYLALTSGQYSGKGTFGGSPTGIDTGTIGFAGSTANIMSQLATAGFSWKTYEEGVATCGYNVWGTSSTGNYSSSHFLARHAPAAFYTTTSAAGVSHGNGRYDFDELATDVAGHTLPDFFIITPNAVNDGHDSGFAPANTWLTSGGGWSGIDNLIASMRTGGMLALTFDNVPNADTTTPITGTGIVYLVIAGPGITHTADSTVSNHFSLLKAVQDLFGVAHFSTSVDSNYTNATALSLPSGGGGGGGGGAGPAPLVTVAYDNSKPRFVNPAGDQILLRGANIIMSAPSSFGPIAQSMGLNMIRLVCNWSNFEATAPTGSGTNYSSYVHTLTASEVAALDSFGSYFASQGIYMLVDFAQANWSPYFGGSGVPSWYYTDARFKPKQNGGSGWTTAQQSSAIAAFWTDANEKPMAQTLYNAWAAAMTTHITSQSWSDHVVGTGIFNEPNPGGMSGSSAAKTSIMQTWLSTTVDTVRAIDPARAIFVMCHGGGQGYGTAVFTDAYGSIATMQSKKMVMEFHAYYTGGLPGKNASAAGDIGFAAPDNDDFFPTSDACHNTVAGSNYTGSLAGQLAFMSVPIAKAASIGLPMFHGEFNARYDDPGRLTYHQHIQAAFDQNKMSGTIWKLGSTPTDSLGLVTNGVLNDMGLSAQAWFKATNFIIKGGGGGSTGPTNTSPPELTASSLTDGQTVGYTQGSWSGATTITDVFQLSADGVTGWTTIPTSAYSWAKGADYGGGYQMNVTPDPLSAGRVFAGGDLWGCFTSTDTGSSWQPANLGKTVKTTGTAPGTSYSRGAAWSQKVPGSVYVGQGTLGGGAGQGGFDKITGLSVTSQSTAIGFGTINGSGSHRPRACGRRVLVDYDSGSGVEYIYALASTSTSAVVSRSTDQGATWTTLFTTGITSASTDVLNAAWKSACLVDSDADGVMDTIIACSYRDWSTDATTRTGSKVWTIKAGSSSIRTATTPSQLTATKVSGTPGIVDDIVNMGGSVYAACGTYGVYAVTSNGATWTPVSANTATFVTPGYWVSAIDGHAATGTLVIGVVGPNGGTNATPANQVATSTNGGASWTWIVNTATVTHASSGGQICTVPWGETHEWWLLASGAPTYHEYPGGSSFQIQEVKFDPTDSSGHTIYVCGASGGWLTKNGGGLWRPANVGLNGSQINHVNPGSGAGDAYCDNVDWKQALTSDHWGTCTRSTTTPTGFPTKGVTDKTDGSGNTYHLNATTGSLDITKNGSSIANDFFRSSLLSISDFQVSPDGYVYIALFGGGMLVGTPSTGGAGVSTWTVPATTDDGMYLRVLETASDAAGHTATVSSVVVGPIAASVSIPVCTVQPTVDQTLVRPAATITWTPGTWSNTPTSHIYLMQRRQTGSSTILSTTALGGTSYVAVTTDIGYDVRFEDTETNAAGTGAPAFSPWTTITNPPPNVVFPTITLQTPPTDITIVAAQPHSYLVTGTAASDSAISVCFVASQAVIVDPTSGSFAQTIVLTDGANPVTVVATDADGNTSTTTNTITLVEPSTGGGGDGGDGNIIEGSDLLRILRELSQRGLE